MPADLRLNQLVTDPVQPEAMAPFHVMAECANTGDEGTGPFTVRFELDQKSESIDLPVENVAPGESQWVNWPHDGMIAGDHNVYCLLDSGHVVPEPNAQDNQRSILFRVAEIEFPPQDVHGDESFSDEALANEVIHTIMERVNMWLTLAVQAVEEWEIEAKARVADYQDADANVDLAPAVLAFGQAVVKYLPGVSTALGVVQDVAGVVALVQSSMGDQHMGLAGARARLLAAIDELKLSTGAALRQVVDGYESQVRARLSTNNNDSPLRNIESGSTEATYIQSLADWLGVPEPSEANTTVPIKQEMMAGFERVMEDVNRQLFREIGL